MIVVRTSPPRQEENGGHPSRPPYLVTRQTGVQFRPKRFAAGSAARSPPSRARHPRRSAPAQRRTPGPSCPAPDPRAVAPQPKPSRWRGRGRASPNRGRRVLDLEPTANAMYSSAGRAAPHLMMSSHSNPLTIAARATMLTARIGCRRASTTGAVMNRMPMKAATLPLLPSSITSTQPAIAEHHRGDDAGDADVPKPVQQSAVRARPARMSGMS